MWGKRTPPPKDYYSTLITELIYWITKNHHLLGNYLKLVCSWIRENCPTIPIPFLYGFGWANCELIPFHLLVEWRCLITLVYLWNIHGCLYSMVSPYETNDTISAWVPQDISIHRHEGNRFFAHRRYDLVLHNLEIFSDWRYKILSECSRQFIRAISLGNSQPRYALLLTWYKRRLRSTSLVQCQIEFPVS
jgi:hypothetical protein